MEKGNISTAVEKNVLSPSAILLPSPWSKMGLSVVLATQLLAE